MIWRKETPQAQQDNDQPRGFDDFELCLGDVLRGERATLGKSLLDVQRELHIRAAYIAAIENGDLAAFETPSFIAGFVRSYARYLGMDPEWVYQRFCAEHDFQVRDGMSGFASNVQRTVVAEPKKDTRTTGLRGVGLLPDPEPFWKRIEPGALGSVSVLVALIAGLGYAGMTVLREVQRVQVAPADIVPSVVSDFDPLAQTGSQSLAAVETDPVMGAIRNDGAIATPVFSQTDGRTATAEGRVRMARPDPLEVPVLVPRDGPIAAITPVHVNPETPQISTDTAVAQALADNADPAPQVLNSGPSTVQLLAVRPAWLRVRSADGTVVFERILDAGETYTIPSTEAAPTLHAGNSNSVYFVIDGQVYGPAAPSAQVVRNVALNVEDLRDSYQVADLSRDQDLAVHFARLNDQ